MRKRKEKKIAKLGSPARTSSTYKLFFTFTFTFNQQFM